MTPAKDTLPKTTLPWVELAWFAALTVGCYAPILYRLVLQWGDDPDMGHGFFVPLVAGMIVWQKREELASTEIRPNWWGLLVVLFGAAQMVLGTISVELFTSRVAFVVTIIGSVWFLGGTALLKKLAFPLALLFLMIPIPGVVYNQLTFRLQLLASRMADSAIELLAIPVVREGNILELSTMHLQVVEACSGIRSLLTLTFLSLVYGFFFDKRLWVRVALFVSTIPIAILANSMRITFTAILSQLKPELAEGFFHESTGWILFLISLGMLIAFHRILVFGAWWMGRRKPA